jgi:hypothetical protein
MRHSACLISRSCRPCYSLSSLHQLGSRMHRGLDSYAMMCVLSPYSIDSFLCHVLQMPKAESYSRILTAHLQSANSELREVDGLNSIVNQLNWRGDNKIAHLLGALPMIAPEQLVGAPGLEAYKSSIKDFSILPTLPVRKVRRCVSHLCTMKELTTQQTGLGKIPRPSPQQTVCSVLSRSRIRRPGDAGARTDPRELDNTSRAPLRVVSLAASRPRSLTHVASLSGSACLIRTPSFPPPRRYSVP